YQNPVVLHKIISELSSDPRIKVGALFDSGIDTSTNSVEVEASFINQRLGGQIAADDMKKLLESVEFTVALSGDTLKIVPPYWRMDIEIKEDIVEEVGRLYGYDRLPTELPGRPMRPVTKNSSIELKQNVRKILASAGANEILTFRFVSGKLLEQAGQNAEQAYKLSNALSPALEYYRLTLTPSVLSKVNQNIRAGFDRIALFEISNTHVKMHGLTPENVPEELGMISLVFAANDKKVMESEGAAYFTAKSFLDFLAKKLGRTFVYKKVDESNSKYEVVKPFDLERSALVSDLATGASIGIIGEFTGSITRKMKASAHSAGFEISSSSLLKVISQTADYQTIPKYPKVSQDITFMTPLELEYATLTNTLQSSLKERATKNGYACMLSPLGSYHKENSSSKNVSYRLVMHHPDRTLTTDEITAYVDSVVSEVESSVEAKRV
ncbi:MAG: phenylalanyl-tRNA synthetase beta chain, partial [Patescibacteria group bacterium]|nr:phenylalanyl-tRNA synthetase beta chain [Patescibacteria group bacterium]